MAGKEGFSVPHQKQGLTGAGKPPEQELHRSRVLSVCVSKERWGDAGIL